MPTPGQYIQTSQIPIATIGLLAFSLSVRMPGPVPFMPTAFARETPIGPGEFPRPFAIRPTAGRPTLATQTRPMPKRLGKQHADIRGCWEDRERPSPHSPIGNRPYSPPMLPTRATVDQPMFLTSPQRGQRSGRPSSASALASKRLKPAEFRQSLPKIYG